MPSRLDESCNCEFCQGKTSKNILWQSFKFPVQFLLTEDMFLAKIGPIRIHCRNCISMSWKLCLLQERLFKFLLLHPYLVALLNLTVLGFSFVIPWLDKAKRTQQGNLWGFIEIWIDYEMEMRGWTLLNFSNRSQRQLWKHFRTHWNHSHHPKKRNLIHWKSFQVVLFVTFFGHLVDRADVPNQEICGTQAKVNISTESSLPHYQMDLGFW